MVSWAAVLSFLQHETLLFAVTGLLIGGIDDLAMDIVYIVRRCWRSAFIYSRHERMTASTLPVPAKPGELAVFIPAWEEANIIGATLRGMLDKWQGERIVLFVGAYPNDRATIAAIAEVAAQSAAVHLVIHERDGPTTKADCLNLLWRAMERDEAAHGRRYKAVILHDAEDVVHPDEPRLFDVMIERFDMVQLPVQPLLNQQSRWIAGHYADEFAESHGKYLSTREALGAAVPSAGVGCAFARDTLSRIADERSGLPFDPHSLTEDYEIGLRIAQQGGRTIFVRMRDAQGELICTQEHFPETLEASVRQKARWMAGIALAGWDRMGWHGSLLERWMRLHDRRAALSALVLFTAYVATLAYGAGLVLSLLTDVPMKPVPPMLAACLWITGGLMLWRLGLRATFSARSYGWRQGVRSVPRALIANIIAILASRRAIGIYIDQMRSGKVVWHKTTHRAATPDIVQTLS